MGTLVSLVTVGQGRGMSRNWYPLIKDMYIWFSYLKRLSENVHLMCRERFFGSTEVAWGCTCPTDLHDANAN